MRARLFTLFAVIFWGRLGILPALAALVYLSQAAPFTSAAEPVPTVFILHSYAENDLFGPPQHKGVLQALLSAGMLPERDYRLRTFYMDTRVRNTTPQQLALVSDQAAALIQEAAPALLVTLDDKAFSEVGLRFVDRPGISVVYSGINNQLEEYNARRRFYDTPQKPGHNVTGVYEQLHVADAFRVQKEILPQTRSILVVTDRSDVGRWLVRQVELELKGLQGWQRKDTASWEEYQQIIRDAGADPQIGAIYPVALLLTDREGKPHITQEIMRWTADHATKPQLALNFLMCRYGLSGGAVVDYVAMGEQAGALGAKILRGRAAGELPLESAKRFALVFNYTTLQRLRLHIPEDLLLAADELYH